MYRKYTFQTSTKSENIKIDKTGYSDSPLGARIKILFVFKFQLFSIIKDIPSAYHAESETATSFYYLFFFPPNILLNFIVFYYYYTRTYQTCPPCYHFTVEFDVRFVLRGRSIQMFVVKIRGSMRCLRCWVTSKALFCLPTHLSFFK